MSCLTILYVTVTTVSVFVFSGIIALMYIELVFNIILFVFAFVLMIGVNRVSGFTSVFL